MKIAVITVLIALALSVLLIVSQTQFSNDGIPPIEASESLPGGATTVSVQPRPSFMLPSNNLPQDQRPDFHAGKALAHQPWVRAPTITTARDGLGPLYNARTCLMCHINGGRGLMPKNDEQMLIQAFLRLSLPGEDKVHGVVPEPVYGDQLQSQSVALAHQLRTSISAQKLKSKEVAPEAYVYIDWQKKTFQYPDGEQLNLRYPKVLIKNLGYGELHPETLTSLRNAPPLQGVGLLELIAQQEINDYADPDDTNEDGISGRVNQVWDFEAKKTTAGRFGLKANKASVRFQTAGAFAGDVGITNPVFPHQPCTEQQELCNRTPSGVDESEDGEVAVELPESLLSLVVNFTRSLGVPERRNINDSAVKDGRKLFYQSGCNQCHRPSYVTMKSSELPHLSEQKIWPYTDLLLHDMGEDLADGRPDYQASGSEWRTPPLWGVGLGAEVNGSGVLLHDGRAQSIEEAIVWHGGEAQSVKQKFVNLDRHEREKLIKFVESL